MVRPHFTALMCTPQRPCGVLGRVPLSQGRQFLKIISECLCITSFTLRDVGVCAYSLVLRKYENTYYLVVDPRIDESAGTGFAFNPKILESSFLSAFPIFPDGDARS